MNSFKRLFKSFGDSEKLCFSRVSRVMQAEAKLLLHRRNFVPSCEIQGIWDATLQNISSARSQKALLSEDAHKKLTTLVVGLNIRAYHRFFPETEVS